jgi:hypothetical protein
LDNRWNWLFLQTQNHRLLVTAYHVLEEIKRISTSQGCLIFIGGNACEPICISGWRTIDGDREIDICTIQVPEDFDAGSLGKQFYYASDWPPIRPTEGECAIIVGYSAEHRAGTENSVLARAAILSDFITHTSVLRFTIADE